MLNISHNKVSKYIDIKTFKSGQNIFNKQYHKRFKRFLLVFSIIILIMLFLPWTQNISSSGHVTTLKPDQRPQTLQSQISGRIETWFIKEGAFVKKGDTILRISEVKSDYFDEKLSERTSDQILAKSASVDAYKNKIDALKKQLLALQKEQELKLEQAKNKLQQSELKIITDSIDLKAIKIKLDIAETQYNRVVTLQKEGLKAVKDVEEKRTKLQEAKAKVISQQNKYLASKNSVINAKLSISTIQTTYDNKLAKVRSDLFATESQGYNTQTEVSKLEIDLANYEKRKRLLFVTAPQDGYVNKAIKSGIGETFKAGEPLVSIMPANYQLAVEMYVKPIDLPLIHIGEDVRIQFDGWPAIVFSGWPNASYGTYGAKVVAIENFISSNGKFRILLSPNADDISWPKAIRVGSGVKAIALLEDVPIWFELWRQLNSFPPNFYKANKAGGTTSKASL